METPEEKARKAFYRVNGKTPEDEGRDSVSALGIALVCGVGLATLGLLELYKLFFPVN